MGNSIVNEKQGESVGELIKNKTKQTRKHAKHIDIMTVFRTTI